jgi:hypothetical protein
MIQYLYEGDYEPRIPVDGTPLVTSTKLANYHYSFPHSCHSDQSGGRCKVRMVCQHHQCSAPTCNYECAGFLCQECTLTWAPPVGTYPAQMLVHVKVYDLGEKFKVAGLKDLARKKFEMWCSKYWEEEDFATAAHLVFSNTGQDNAGLREVVAKVVSDHISLLNKPTIEALMDHPNGLGGALVRIRARELGWNKSVAR